MEQLKLKQKCADPLLCHKGQCRKKSLRIIPEELVNKFPDLHLTIDHRLCKQCREHLESLPGKEKDTLNLEMFDDDSRNSIQPEKLDKFNDHDNGATSTSEQHYEMSILNTSLVSIGESPLKKRKLLEQKSYGVQKLNQMTKTVKKRMEIVAGKEISDSQSKKQIGADVDGLEIINQLKEKFKKENINRSEKIKILTVLPKSWSIRKIASEFNTTRHTASIAKKIVEEKGVLSDPNPRDGKRIKQDTVDAIKAFYLSEDISRIMPGKKDFCSIIDNERGRIHLQKHLLLCNLKEAYQTFKERNPLLKVGFSKFAELRPKQCVIAGATGTHSVCVCSMHQNAKLMFVGADLAKLTVNDETPIKNVRHCVAFMECNPASQKCCLRQCEQCGDPSDLQERLLNIFENNFIDNITFKKWTNTDRSSLDDVKLTTDEFIEHFCDLLKQYQVHDFKTKMQATYYRETKMSLKDGEVLVVCDFAENYSFVIQDEVQSFHWNNEMATLHPFVIYYRKENEIAHLSFVIISECNIHDTVAVHLFQKHLINFLKEKISTVGSIHKIIYFSDGCAGQYKNCKNFLNLCHHREDFGIEAEWNFFATSHGKGPCDGVGGTVKRIAAKASLQRPYDEQILTAEQLYTFASENIVNIKCHFSTNKEHEEESQLLQERHLNARTIAGTQKLHHLQPVSLTSLKVKHYSLSDHSSIEKVTEKEEVLPEEKIHGFVTVAYDGHWWVAYVMEKTPENREVKVTFLHPHGPNPSFVYPARPDELILPYSDVLTQVEASTTNGRTYTICKKVTSKACKALANLQHRRVSKIQN